MPNTQHTTRNTAPKASGSKATPAQLNYLRSLAATAGESFAYPATKADASREIRRLRGRAGQANRRLVAADTRRDRTHVSRELQRGYGTGIDHEDFDEVEPIDTPSEISGWGSTARYA